MGIENRRILVVDDEPGVQMIFSKILQDLGYEIQYFSRAEHALAHLESAPPYKMCFLDIRMPGMDGVSALPKFRDLQPEMKIIMMTAFQTVDSVVTTMKAGAVDYLVKPLDPQVIAQSVQKYFDATSSLVSDNSSEKNHGKFVANSEAMKSVLSIAVRFSAVDEPVLLLGESGTGKEFLAHYIHGKSPRSSGPFVIVDCASLPETLFESELFGYEKGAFTGADSPKTGRFEAANGGTLFLDEIGNVPLFMQAKLLRFIEDRTLTRLGGNKPVSLDIRIIAATNSDLKKGVQGGQFREDLYYRLGALTIQLLPLRNRSLDEKESLIRHFLERNTISLKRKSFSLSEAAHKLVMEYPWPGNIRELKHALYSSALLCDGEKIEVSHFPVGIQSYLSHRDQHLSPVPSGNQTMREILKKVEKEQIFSALKKTGGNKKKASEMLDMDYKSFLGKLKEYSGDSETGR